MTLEKRPPNLDLVPDFDDQLAGPTPVDVLREQADLIEAKTRGELRARVESATSRFGNVAYQLVLEAPVIQYRYKVLGIEFGIEAWPVYVSKPEAPSPEKLVDLEQYVEYLRGLFGSEAFRSAVTTMRHLSRTETSLSAIERQVLQIFSKYKFGAEQALSTKTLMEASQLFSPPAGDRFDDALSSLVRNGCLEQTADGVGYVLTEKGARILYVR